jgi:hypothetical protein
MTGRDRMVLIVIGVVVVLGAAWMLIVSPERQKASKLGGEVSAAQAQVAAAESTVSSARAAQSQYAAAYASLVNIGKAVPPSEEVPALIDQLTQASNEKNVEFSAITPGASTGASASGSASGSASTSTSASAASPSSGAAASGQQAAGFTEVPFTFSFGGSYFDLEHLFRKLTEFTTLNAAGKLEVNGRLLTINSVSLTAASGAEPGKPGGALTGSITATAYVMPASAGLTATTGTSPSTSAAASPASSTSAGSSTPAPAIVKVNP